MNRLLLTISIIGLANFVFAQNYFSENERYYQLTNGLELLLIKDKSQDEIIVSYSSKTGAYTESKKLDGVTKVFGELFFIKSIENPSTINNQKIFRQGIQQSYDIGEEHLSFILNFNDKNLLTTGLKFFKKQLSDTSITQSAIDFTTNRLSRNYVKSRAEELLWGDYYNRMNLQIHPDSIDDGLKEKVQQVQKLNLCPQNSLVVIAGDIDFKTVLDQVQNTLGGLEKCNFSYFNQYPIPNIEPLRFNQQILSYEQTNFRAEYYFQGPNLRDNIKAIMAGSILDELLKDKYGREGISINHGSLYYANVLKLEAKANSKDKFVELHQMLKSDFLGEGKIEFLTTELLESTKASILQKIEIITGNPKLKIRLVQMMWASKDINLFPKLEAELKSVKLADVQSLIDIYMKQNNYILNLVIPNPSDLSDSLEIETAGNIDAYELLFKKNSAELLNHQQDSILENLIFFLKLNPGTKVKVVGLASKSELIEVKDKETYKFVKNEFEGFNVFPPSLRPNSAKIRLDIYRSIKIAQRLQESGIDIKRLFGSGRLDKEESEEMYKVYFREMD